MEGTDLLVPEERVRHPDFTSIGQGQISDPLWNYEGGFLLLLNFNDGERQ